LRERETKQANSYSKVTTGGEWMRVRFRSDAAVMTDHGILPLGGKEAEVELAPEGRYKWVVPEGRAAGDTIYIEEDKVEEVLNRWPRPTRKPCSWKDYWRS
jgi:hypothetical protein